MPNFGGSTIGLYLVGIRAYAPNLPFRNGLFQGGG